MGIYKLTKKVNILHKIPQKMNFVLATLIFFLKKNSGPHSLFLRELFNKNS